MNHSEKNLEQLRHSCAHLLAAAVLELYPDSKPTLGPAIENGFYYDFDFGNRKISEDDFVAIESKMKELLPKWTEFSSEIVSSEKALQYFAGNEYKLELIKEIESRGETITFYTCGGFTDLCRGGHSENPSIDLQAFTLTSLAGAYWRGSEKNKMLTRIYGTAFPSQKELDDYLTMLAEAKKRDHKVLGPALDLFTFSPLVGAGLPLWTPKGTMLRNLLDEKVWELRSKYGYQKVEIPHITKKDLYEKSGHWEKFKDELFRITTREGHEFAMKPMNCPHHNQIFARKLWSYREMPQRYANTTMCYRDEQSGELSGLSRVRSLTQDDAHIYCRMDQVEKELAEVWDIVNNFYHLFGFDLTVRLSTRDLSDKSKYLGSEDNWDKAEAILSKVAKNQSLPVIEGPGEAAFYGPKLDFMTRDSLGRSWQVATIQLDMVQPERFDLHCINEAGEKERIVMIHAAIMGSIDRFISILIEHTAGNFPLWLAPVQIVLLPIADRHQEYAKNIQSILRSKGVRCELDDSANTLGNKIRTNTLQKIPLFGIIGDQEVESGQNDRNLLSIRTLAGENLGTIELQKLLIDILKII